MKLCYQTHQYAQQRQREKKRWIWPVHMAMEATHMRDIGHQVTWDQVADHDATVITEPQGLDFMLLPAPDRKLTNAFDPKYQANGNYKHNPGTYIQSAAGCWWGKCTFCKEKGTEYKLRNVADVIDEIRECKEQGFREVFDDADSFPTGEWREEFCWMLRNIDITFSCNMRFGTLTGHEYVGLKNSGFRMLLYGLESANQGTLDRINKGINIDSAINELKVASGAGLEPHVACMFGYPWETDEDAIRTLKLVQWLLRKGYAKTAQASLYTPPLNQIMHIDTRACAVNVLRKESHQKYVHQIYNAAYYPDFWLNKLRDMRTYDDLTYLWKGIKSCFGK